ncbi:hypothetical protein BHE74_00013759 [Ensete ventricosum]|nr:hypothetical protein BHE74_00013759 [Ensete ventricosum]
MAPATATIVSTVSSSDVARSFHSSRPTLDPLLYHCHRRAPPLCSIVTGFDLWPTIPSPPNSALLLLSLDRSVFFLPYCYILCFLWPFSSISHPSLPTKSSTVAPATISSFAVAATLY